MASQAWRKLAGGSLKELRFHFCQTSKGSEGIRDFVHKNYKDLKVQNPAFPFLIRECSGIEAKVWARYGFGKERVTSVEGLDASGVEKSIKDLVAAASP